jgi:hypothetical protein
MAHPSKVASISPMIIDVHAFIKHLAYPYPTERLGNDVVMKMLNASARLLFTRQDKDSPFQEDSNRS